MAFANLGMIGGNGGYGRDHGRGADERNRPGHSGRWFGLPALAFVDGFRP